VAFPKPIHRARDDVGGAHEHIVAGGDLLLACLFGVGEQELFGSTECKPVRYIPLFRKLWEQYNGDDGDDLAQRSDDLAGMGTAIIVVIFEDVDQLFALEPLRKLRLPLLGAAGIGGRDQAELCNVVNVFFALAKPCWGDSTAGACLKVMFGATPRSLLDV
jgi:hypothetical protein